MAFQLVLFVRMFMILIIDNYKRCVLIKSNYVYNERHEYFKRNISKERYTYIYTISDTDQQSTFHLYAKNA